MPDMWMDVDVALSEVPVNIMPLIDDTDFKSPEEGVAYNQAGLDLIWNFVTTAGVYTQTGVTPTTGGDYDWVHQGFGMYTIEIIDTGGASINNDTEGFGWFTGWCTGVLPWRGPTIGLRAAGLNNKLVDSAYSATRGLAGTALPDAVSDAAGGLPISDAGELDLDTDLGNLDDSVSSRAAASVVGALDDAAAAGEVTEADTLMQYLKQLINILIGATGIVAFPAEAGPANGVSLAEVIRAIHVDVTGLNGDAMVGTDGANTTVPDAAGVAPTAAEIKTAIEAGGSSLAQILLDTGTDGVVLKAAGLNADAITAIWAKAMTDIAQGAPSATCSALTALNYLYEAWRNKTTTTATLITVMKDDTTTGMVKSTISDNGVTFIKGEMATGA